jgi:hypothetical protein
MKSNNISLDSRKCEMQRFAIGCISHSYEVTENDISQSNPHFEEGNSSCEMT